MVTIICLVTLEKTRSTVATGMMRFLVVREMMS